MSANTGTKAAARRVVAITGGWVVAACAEAAAYLALGRAIMSGASVAAVLAAAALSLLATTVVARAGYHAGVRLGGELYKAMGLALQRAKPAWFTAQNRTLAVTTAGRGIPSLMSVPAHELQTYVVAVTVPVMLCVGVAILVDGATAAVCALAVIVALVAQVVAQRALAAADGKRAAAARASDAAAMELVDHAELLRTASGTSGAVNRIERRWRMEESALRRTNAAAAPATALTVLASALPMILVAWYLVSRQEPAWTVLAVVVLAARATGPLESLAVAGIGARSIVSTVSDVRAISGAPVLALPTAPRVPNGSAIEFDKVSTPQISTEVSARIDDGAVVALVGPSGSGKTTLLGLIARFDDPDRGAVTLGGVPLPDLAAGDIASAISFVPQEPIVFTGTVADNVRVGNPAASDGDVRAALASAGLDSLVATAPDGIDLPVGHRGESLSGGERQRLEIARALVKRAPVLLLDEPTSALDPETERIVIDGVRATGATVFVVTHRGAEQWRPDVTIELRG